jgi:hypothetical protein
MIWPLGNFSAVFTIWIMVGVIPIGFSISEGRDHRPPISVFPGSPIETHINGKFVDGAPAVSNGTLAISTGLRRNRRRPGERKELRQDRIKALLLA